MKHNRSKAFPDADTATGGIFFPSWGILKQRLNLLLEKGTALIKAPVLGEDIGTFSRP